MANFKIAITAGHYKYTPGKRCMKALDPNETREWVLNDRIADKIETLLKNYTGYELLRTDDTTGEKEVDLADRTTKANVWGADFYLSIHHNAGANGTAAGGITAYVRKSPLAESVEWQKALYNALIAETGLKGNRASPLYGENLHEVYVPKMPSVLLELGFMDSKTDVPIILTEKFADQCAKAIVGVIAERAKLKKISEPLKEPKKEMAQTQTKPVITSEPFEVKAGKAISLRNEPYYIDTYTNQQSGTLYGTYYFWSSEIIRGRAKITTDQSKVGVKGQVLCWINVPDNAEVVYVVKRGDTLGAIAKKYNTTVKVLAAHNGIKNPDLIWVGQKIRIP